MYFSESTSLYIYSSFLQANVTIIAFLGIFIVYKMQSHKASIDVIKAALYGFCKDEKTAQPVIDFEAVKSENKPTVFKSMEENVPFYKFYSTWAHHIERIQNLRDEITLPTVLIMVGVSYSSIMLFFCSNLCKYHHIAETIFAGIGIVLHLYVWSFIACKLIKIIKHG